VLGTPASANFQPQDFTMSAASSAARTANPILFVTQPPVPSEQLTVATTFGNHRGEPHAAGRGGAPNPQPGRRALAQPLHDPAALAANIPNAAGPAGSMVLAGDGYMAAFVPARRALTWLLTDANGLPVVRERVWVSFQPGEIRVCTSCHDLNDKDQAGNTAPTNPPQALNTLMQYWKAQLTLRKLYLPLVVR
jgi:hypothetical protein